MKPIEARIAELLQAHTRRLSTHNDPSLHDRCSCGWVGRELAFDYWEHVSAVMARLVREMQGEAVKRYVEEMSRLAIIRGGNENQEA